MIWVGLWGSPQPVLSAEVLENFIASAFCPLRNLDQLGGALWPKGLRRSHSDRRTHFFLGRGGNLRIFYFVACCVLFVDVLSFKFSSRSCGKNEIDCRYIYIFSQ